MAEKRLDIRVIEDLPLLELDDDNLPDTIVFHSTVNIPLIQPNSVITNITADPQLKYIAYMPYGYRKRYLHPGIFHIDLVQPEIKKKLKKLSGWLHQKSNKLFFCITPDKPDSVLNVCTYLGDLFDDCKNPDASEYSNITNIPYPLKISTYSKDHSQDWIWSCYWPSYLKKKITYDELPDGKELFEFPTYSDRWFPVRSLENVKDDGVIAFSVSVGIRGGEVIVVPQRLLEKFLPDPREDVTLYIEDIPPVLNSPRAREHVKIRLLYKHCNIVFREVNLYWFIRFMYIYYCTQTEKSFRYKLDGKKLIDRNFADSSFTNAYSFLLNSEKNQPNENFPATLKEIIKRCINPKEMKAEDAEIIYKLVYHQKTLAETGLKDLQLTNLKIIFSLEAWNIIENIKIERGLKIIKKLKGIWAGVFKMVSSVASAEDINFNE